MLSSFELPFKKVIVILSLCEPMDAYSLECSFSAFSINDVGSATDSSAENPSPATLDLNSHLSLPYQWEQCLDLKTGEIYYIDWRNGRKAKVDPRRVSFNIEGSDDGEADSGEEVDGYYEGSLEGSDDGSCSSSCSSTEGYLEEQAIHQSDVLVVAGCKRCLMYFMLPKVTDECPKCCSLLLHFNGSENPLL